MTSEEREIMDAAGFAVKLLGCLAVGVLLAFVLLGFLIGMAL